MKNKLIKIIGIGSPFGDDQVGCYMVEKLKNNQFIQSLPAEQLNIDYLDRPGVDLLSAMRDATVVIIIDAVKSGADIGTLHHYEDESIFTIKNHECSTHGFGLAQTLNLGKALNELPDTIIFYGVEVDGFDAAKISEKVRTALICLEEKITKRIKSFLL